MKNIFLHFSKWTLCMPIITVLIQWTKGEVICGTKSGTKSYDDAKELCCGGFLNPLYQNGTKMGCCTTSQGISLYQIGTELCCGEQVGVPTSYMIDGQKHTRQCCMKEQAIAESHKNEVCCGGPGGTDYRVTLLNKTTDSCCGSERYVPSQQSCCEDGDNTRITQTPHTENTRCCGLEKYNIDQHSCLDGKLNPIKDGFKWCSGYVYYNRTYYNTETHICCYEGNVTEKPSSNALPRYAVKPDYRCREGFIWDAKKDEFAPSRSGTIAHLYPIGQISCGNGSWNPHETKHREFCCSGTFRNSSLDMNVDCCGTELYHRDWETCCGRQIYNNSGFIGCCDGVMYNKRDQECCDSQLIGKTEVCCSVTLTRERAITKTASDHTACCYLRNDTKASYNGYKQECQGGQIIPKRESAITPSTVGVTVKPNDRTRRPPAPGPPRFPSEPRDNVPEDKNRCPYCGPRKRNQILNTCNLQRAYKVLLKNLTMTDKGTTLEIKINGPWKYRGHTMNIYIPYHCKCFKTGKSYKIYTNRDLGCRRNIRFKNDNNLIMRLSSKNRKLRRQCNAVSDVRRRMNNRMFALT